MLVIPIHGILHFCPIRSTKNCPTIEFGHDWYSPLGIHNVPFFPSFPFKFQYNQQYIEKKIVFICNVFGKSIWFISTKHRRLHSKCVILVSDVNLFIFLQYDTQRLCQTYTMSEHKSVASGEGDGSASVFTTIKKYVECAAFYSTGMMWETSTRQINTWNMFRFMRHQRIPTLCLHQTICNNKMKQQQRNRTKKSGSGVFSIRFSIKKNVFLLNSFYVCVQNLWLFFSIFHLNGCRSIFGMFQRETVSSALCTHTKNTIDICAVNAGTQHKTTIRHFSSEPHCAAFIEELYICIQCKVPFFRDSG